MTNEHYFITVEDIKDSRNNYVDDLTFSEYSKATVVSLKMVSWLLRTFKTREVKPSAFNLQPKHCCVVTSPLNVSKIFKCEDLQKTLHSPH